MQPSDSEIETRPIDVCLVPVCISDMFTTSPQAMIMLSVGRNGGTVISNDAVAVMITWAS